MALRWIDGTQDWPVLSSMANDLTQDATRSVYWLLNAAQATGEVINEKILAETVHSFIANHLYRVLIYLIRKWLVAKKIAFLNIKDKMMREEMLNRGYAKNIMQGGEEKLTAARGYSFDDVGDLQKT